MKNKFNKILVFTVLFFLPASFLLGQAKSLEKSFDLGEDSTGLTTIDKVYSITDSIEMLRKTLTIRGGDNKIFTLEYFFPQLIIKAPFSFNIPEGNADETTDTENKKSTDEQPYSKPSVKKMVTDTDPTLEKSIKDKKEQTESTKKEQPAKKTEDPVKK
ncbi:MAG: hypothetical protein ACOYXC_18965 [Candidatus Rifleibacteriota bacterium]